MSSENVNGSDQRKASENVPVLNLSSIKSVEELDLIPSMENVGVVLVPEEFVAAVSRIPMKNVGGVVGVPTGEAWRVKTLVGELTLGAEVLQNPGELVVLAGVIAVVGELTSVQCRLAFAGQIIVPEAARGAISAALVSVAGEVFYYKGSALRRSQGDQTLGKGFLECLPEPTAFFVQGNFTVEDDVTIELLRAKVSDILVQGDIRTTKALKPMVQVLASYHQGGFVITNEE